MGLRLHGHRQEPTGNGPEEKKVSGLPLTYHHEPNGLFPKHFVT